jgi:hypothetical protein
VSATPQAATHVTPKIFDVFIYGLPGVTTNGSGSNRSPSSV